MHLTKEQRELEIRNNDAVVQTEAPALKKPQSFLSYLALGKWILSAERV